jgi:hypothetical protein
MNFGNSRDQGASEFRQCLVVPTEYVAQELPIERFAGKRARHVLSRLARGSEELARLGA